MSSNVPNRSAHGCITCKQRRKKCDETKPICARCESGGFSCLGYNPASKPKALSSRRPRTTNTKPSCTFGASEEMFLVEGRSSTHNAALPSSSWFTLEGEGARSSTGLQQAKSQQHPNGIPRNLSLEPALFNQMLPLIMSQCVQFAYSALFKPFPIEEGLTLRLDTSNIIRWTMYISARIAQALLNGCRKQEYISWIDVFHRQISESSNSAGLEVQDLLARLSGLQDLYFCSVVVSGSSNGYSMFKKCAPLFLQLATNYPRLWSPRFTISIRRVLNFGEYDMMIFVFFDTMSSLAFSTPPLMDYDTTPNSVDGKEAHQVLEWIYGCPSLIVFLLARINSWRTSRWINQSNWDAEDWREIEKILLDWDPAIELVDGSPNLIGRLAVQESWRQAVLIYLYMGMCDVDSADPRIQSSVRQIVQLMGTVEEISTLGRHFFMPCLVAGVAARQEKHRAILRSKIQDCQNEKIWILRGDDFVPVLDHLWHGVGSNGSPTTWADYADSRCAALPVDA